MVECIALAAALAFVLVAAAPAVASSPSQGEFFEYNSTTTVDQGTGMYDQYTETTTAHYRYTVESVSGDAVTMLGTGSWSYQNSSGGAYSGADTYHPVFSVSTRRYISGSDVPNVTDPLATVWFWIPTNVTVGQPIKVLDEPLTVLSLSATVWLGAVPHLAIQVQGSGSYIRNDAYGYFRASYTDTFYYDRATGLIVSEQYTEQDTNDYPGTLYYPATFRYRYDLSVTATSYAVPLDLLVFSLLYIGVPAAAVLVIVGVIRVRRGPSRLHLGSGAEAVTVRIRKAKNPADVIGLIPDGSPFFGPFLPVFAERSIAEGDPVVLALADRKIVGMSLLDRESGMGSLFATDDAVVRVLAKRVRMRDFFADATIPGRIVRAKEIDRFTILQLRNPPVVDYDSSVIRPMSADDLPLVIGIAETVYGGRARKFIESSFKAGDLGFVATADGVVAGFGFAMVVGSVARLHTLTVGAPYRARGLGTELMNARLSALAALGVDRVIVEISKQNAASLRIAARAGFAPIGETVYYSRAPWAAPTALQRQT